MGSIFVTLTITNRADRVLADRGIISADLVRSIPLDKVLLDTGATTLCLPADIIEQLGLEILREVEVEMPGGIEKVRLFRDATIRIFDREGTFECLELPRNRSPLLGVIPLEALGIELDLQQQTARPLPIAPDNTYLTIKLSAIATERAREDDRAPIANL